MDYKAPKGSHPTPRVSPTEVLEKFHQRLLDTATDNDGSINVDQIQAIFKEIQRELPSPPTLTGPERKELPKSGDDARQELVGRILVSRFESLLSPPNAPPSTSSPLPRAIIPPFFRALRMMIGSSTLQQAHEFLLDEVNALKNTTPPLSTEELWEELQNHPGTIRLSIQLFSKMATSFEGHYLNRLDWFVRLVNTLLSSPSTPPIAADNQWTFSQKHCVAILVGLSSDTRSFLAQPDGAKLLKNELGISNLEPIYYLLEQLCAET